MGTTARTNEVDEDKDEPNGNEQTAAMQNENVSHATDVLMKLNINDTKNHVGNSKRERMKSNVQKVH